ncbi:hypothetical protein GOBAR_DD01358 [Gossypium barbadense]|nr:hypothetical protein GOBAR_DD01358 [Gossypium barbadense]
MDKVREELGPWQHKSYRRTRNQIRGLEWKIDKLMDNSNREDTTNLLKMAHIRWLREGDRNTHYFHVCATSRKKENQIEKIRDSSGTWHTDKKDICNVAWSYFNDLFKSTTDSLHDVDMHYIKTCVTDELNYSLDREFTDEELPSRTWILIKLQGAMAFQEASSKSIGQ